MLYLSKTYIGTNEIEKFTVFQAKAKNLLLIRQNKILKIVCGILYLTPKARLGGCSFLAADEISGGFPCIPSSSDGMRRRGGSWGASSG